MTRHCYGYSAARFDNEPKVATIRICIDSFLNGTPGTSCMIRPHDYRCKYKPEAQNLNAIFLCKLSCASGLAAHPYEYVIPRGSATPRRGHKRGKRPRAAVALQLCPKSTESSSASISRTVSRKHIANPATTSLYHSVIIDPSRIFL